MLSLYSQFKLLEKLRILLCFSVNYSVQPKSVFIFSHFKPVFNIFQGFQVVSGKDVKGVILPSCSFFEQKAVFLRVNGTARFSEKIQSRLGLAVEDEAVLFAIARLFNNADKLMPINSFKVPLAESTKNTLRFMSSGKAKINLFFSKKQNEVFKTNAYFINKSLVLSFVTDFYKTDSMTLLSKNLAVCAISENTL
jgi:hypothetical protein